jgi:hypothetical protein
MVKIRIGASVVNNIDVRFNIVTPDVPVSLLLNVCLLKFFGLVFLLLVV